MATIREQQQRRSVTRRVPTRRSSKSQTDLQKPSLTFSEKRKQAKSERELFQRIENVSKDFLKQANNINELETLRNQFIRQNVSRVPEQYQKELRNISTREAQKVINKQKKTISDLKNNIDKWKKDEDRFDDKGDKEDDPKRRARFKAREKYYDTLVDEGQKILQQRLSKGDILDSNKINSFLKDKANFEKDKREAREERKILETKAKEKELEIKEYFERPNVMASPPSAQQIQKDLNVDKRTADLISDSAKESAKAKVSFVNELKKTVDKGARYTNEQLNKAGLSLGEIREIREKEQRADQQIANKLDSFSSNIQNKLDNIKFETKVNKFLEFVGKPQDKQLPQSFLPKDVTEVQNFRNLNPREQNAVLTYAGLRNIKNNVQDVDTNLNKIKQREVFNLLPSSAIAELSGIKLKRAVELKKFDPKELTNLKNLSNEDIKKISVNQDNTKINKIIDNYNRYADNIKTINQLEKKLNKDKIKELISLYEGKLADNLRKKGIVVTAQDLKKPSYKTLVGSQIYYVGVLAELNDALKKNKTITQNQYDDYKKSLKDVLGIKELSRKTADQIKKNKKEYGNVKGFFKSLVSIIKFTSASANELWKELNKDAFFLGKLVGTAFRKTGQAYNSFRKDFYDLGKFTSQKLRGLPTSKKNIIFSRTRKSWNDAFKKTKDITSFIINNPELIVLGLAVGVAQGVKVSRETVVKDPAKAVGVLASFFVDDIILSEGIKGLKVGVKSAKALKVKAIQDINNLIRKTKRIPSLRIIGKKLFKKGKQIPLPSKIEFKVIPDNKFRYPVKDSEGVIRFLDKSSAKKFRRSVVASYSPKQIEPDLIKQAGRIRRTDLKELKKSTRAERLSLEKERRALRKAQKEASKITPKAKRPDKFKFYDIRTNSLRTFTKRKDWIRAVKRQEKLIKDGVLKVPLRLESGQLLAKDVRKFPEWKFTDKGVFYKGNKLPSATSKKITSAKKIAIKDATGNVRYIDRQTLKRFRKEIKKNFDFEEIKPDLIEQTRRILQAKKERASFRKIREKTTRKTQQIAKRRIKKRQRLDLLKRKSNEKVRKTNQDVIEIITDNKRIKIDPKKRKIQEYVKVDKPIKSEGGQVLLQKQEYLVRTKTIPKQKQELVVKTATQKLEDAFPVAKQKYGFAQKRRVSKKTIQQDLVLLKKPKIATAKKVKVALKYLSIQDVYNIFASPIQLFRRLNLSKTQFKKLQSQDLKRISKIGRLSETILKRLSKTGKIQDRKVKQTVKQIPALKQEQIKAQKLLNAIPTKKKQIKKIPERIRIKPTWDSKLPKGYERLVNVVVRVKGKNKEINTRTTPNRALNYITRLVDNTTSRSFSLKLVGITKAKDIKSASIINKFRPKISKGSKVLPFVEKSKFAIDTRGEKTGLTINRLFKAKSKKTNKRKKKSNKKKSRKTKKK